MTRDKHFYKLLLTIAIPTAFQGFISLGVNMLDNIMVGGLGDVTLASVALANQVTVLISFFIKGVTGGAAVLISQYWGKNDMGRIRQVFAVAFQIGIAVTFLFSAVIFMFPRQVMLIFSGDEAVIAQGILYIRILVFSYMISCITETMVAMLRCVEIVRIGIITSLISLFSNLFLNYTLIYGHFGAPRLEIRGAALATVLARVIEVVVVLVYLFKIDKKLCMKLRDLCRVNVQMTRDFVRYGVPIVLGDMQWGLVGLVKNAMLGHMGVLMVAANSITETVFSLFYVFITGLSSGACVIIGKAVGSGDYKYTRECSRTIQLLFFGVGILTCAAMYSVSGLMPRLYNVSAETKALATSFIALNAFMSLGTCYHAACFTGINRGAGDGKFVMKVDMICGWLVVLPLTYLTGFVLHSALPVVYICTRIDQCFKWIVAFFRLRGDKWIKNVTRD